MIGATPNDIQRAQPLADIMSETLLAFARTGNSNHAGLARWPAYDPQHRPTTIWNTPPNVIDDPRGPDLAAQAHYRQPAPDPVDDRTSQPLPSRKAV